LFLRHLEVGENLIGGSRSNQDAEDLLPGPQLHGGDDRGGREVHLEKGVSHHRDELSDLGAVEELVFAGEQIRRGEEILRRGDENLSVFRRAQVVVHRHELHRLRPRLLRLRAVDVHLVPVEVRVVRRAHALVEPQRAPRHHPRPVRHDAHLVQARLSVEEQHVAVLEVALDDVPELEFARDPSPVAVLQVLRPAGLEPHEVRARVAVHAVSDALAHGLDVVPGDHLGVRHHLRDVERHPHLVDPEVRIRGDHRPPAEVHALAAQVPAEPALLPLQPLHEPAEGFPGALVLQRQPGQLAVDVHGALDLEKVPVLHQVRDGQPLLQALPQDVVHLDDLDQLHRDVVLVAPSDAVHLHARADAHGRDGEVRQDEVLGAVGDVQELAIRRRDLLQDAEHPDRVEVVLNPTEVGPELVVVLHSLLELADVLLHQIRVLAVLLVDDLQARARALHHAVGRAARVTQPTPLAPLRDLLTQRAPRNDLQPGVPKPLQVLLLLLGGEHDAAARLAHLLQDGDDVFEVADVEHGHLELDVPEMPGAVDELALTRRALRALLVRGAHARVQDAVG
jgi:hypothetical protein